MTVTRHDGQVAIMCSEEEAKIIRFALHAYAAPEDCLTINQAPIKLHIVEDMACKLDK